MVEALSTALVNMILLLFEQTIYRVKRLSIFERLSSCISVNLL